MKKVQIILILFFLSLNLFSQQINHRVIQTNVIRPHIDTCDCNKITIKEFKYNIFGKLKKKPKSIKEKLYSKGKEVSDIVYQYDSLGRITMSSLNTYNPSSKTNKISYTGQLINIKVYRRDLKDSSSLEIVKEISHYLNKKNQVISTTIKNIIPNHGKFYTLYDYDKQGNLIKQFNSRDSIKKTKLVVEHVYDKNGNQIEFKEYRPFPEVAWKLAYVYNELNQLVEEKTYNFERYFSGSTIEYYENGLVKSETHYGSKKRFDMKFFIEYNKKGYQTKVIRVNKRGKPKSLTTYEYE